MDAVIFDFGGVLTTSPSALMARKAAEAGHDIGEVMHLLLGPLEEDTNHPWHRIERGEITLDELTEDMIGVFEAAGHARPVTPPTSDEMNEAIEPAVEMIDLARAARASGRRTAILSNNIRDWDWRPIVGADNLVDEIVDSCEVGLRKPDEAIYQLTMDRLGVSDPTRCVFIDDFAWNIPPAQRIGMHTVHVTDPAVAATELRGLLDL